METLNKHLNKLIKKGLIKKNEKSKTYKLTKIGLNLACHIASWNKMFKTHIGGRIFLANFGKELKSKSFLEVTKKELSDFFKKYYEYNIDVNGF